LEAPNAVKVVETPAHTVVTPDMVTFGALLTTTVAPVEAVQPLALVAVRPKPVVIAGDTVMLALV
jgi:hypothetical protein